MHYYKKNIGDYAKKAGRLTMLQHGAYTLLIDSCYDRERFPTLEEAIEWTWASNQDEKDAVIFVLGKFFDLENGVYVQNRIKEELNEYHIKALKNKQIALDREENRRRISTNREHTVNEPPPNHKPITNNHSIGAVAPKTPKGKRFDLQEIPTEWIEFCTAERKDLNPKDVFNVFKDYWVSQPGQKGVKVDWLATWRNWVRNQKQGNAKLVVNDFYSKLAQRG